jgi:hypothetical protein
MQPLLVRADRVARTRFRNPQVIWNERGQLILVKLPYCTVITLKIGEDSEAAEITMYQKPLFTFSLLCSIFLIAVAIGVIVFFREGPISKMIAVPMFVMLIELWRHVRASYEVMGGLRRLLTEGPSERGQVA